MRYTGTTDTEEFPIETAYTPRKGETRNSIQMKNRTHIHTHTEKVKMQWKSRRDWREHENLKVT